MSSWSEVRSGTQLGAERNETGGRQGKVSMEVCKTHWVEMMMREALLSLQFDLRELETAGPGAAVVT